MNHFGIHRLRDIYDPHTQAGLPNGRVVLKVAEPYDGNRLRAAWAVLTGRAYAFQWPEDGELERAISKGPPMTDPTPTRDEAVRAANGDNRPFPNYEVMPDPTDEMLASPQFEAIWNVIKSWDVNVPEAYSGYCGVNGSHVAMILKALASAPAPASGRVDAVAELDAFYQGWLSRWRDQLASLSPAATPVEAGGEIERLAKELGCEADAATVFREALKLARQTAAGLVDAPRIPTCGPIAPMNEQPDAERYGSEFPGEPATVGDLFKPTLAKPASSPAGGDVVEREVAAQAALARIKNLRGQYADQAKFADVDEARLFRQFVERLDRAALSQSTSDGEN